MEIALKTLITSAMLALSISPAVAQTAPQEGGVDQNAAAEGEIIVTARRTGERLQDVPIAISTVSGAGLEQAGVFNTRDIGVVVPGFMFNRSVTNASPTIRGVTTSTTDAGSDPNVATYIDGIYVPGQGSIISELPDVEQIAVLKGPQGTLFGRNATGGAIQITTRSPQFKFAADLNLKVSDYSGGGQNVEGKGFVTGPISDNLAASLAVFYRRGSGYLTNVANNTRCCDYESGVVRGKLLYELSDDIKVTVGGYWTSIDDPANFATGTNITGLGLAPSLIAAGVFPATPIPTRPWTVAFNKTPYQYPREHPNITLGGFVRADIDLGGVKLTSLTGYGERKPGRIVIDLDLSALPIADLYASTSPGRTWSQEFNLVGSNGALSYVAGLYLYDDKSRGDLYVNGAALLVGEVHSRAWAPFAEANYNLTDRLTLTGGLRYTRERKEFSRTFNTALPLSPVDEKSWGRFTPRLSLKYSFDRDTMTYLTYSKGFNSGIYTVTSSATTPVDPELITMYEAGFKMKKRAFSLNAAAFYYNYSSLQITQFTGAGQVTTNAASARVYGLDVDANIPVTPEFSLSAAVGYLPSAKYLKYQGAVVNIPDPAVPFGLITVSADVSQRRMIRAPKLTVSVSPNYSHEFAAGKISASLTGYYNSGYAHEPLNRIGQGRYFLLNGTISWVPAGSSIELSLWARNLTNSAVKSGYVASNTADWVVYDEPREIGVSARVTF